MRCSLAFIASAIFLLGTTSAQDLNVRGNVWNQPNDCREETVTDTVTACTSIIPLASTSNSSTTSTFSSSIMTSSPIQLSSSLNSLAYTKSRKGHKHKSKVYTSSAIATSSAAPSMSSSLLPISTSTSRFATSLYSTPGKKNRHPKSKRAVATSTSPSIPSTTSASQSPIVTSKSLRINSTGQKPSERKSPTMMTSMAPAASSLPICPGLAGSMTTITVPNTILESHAISSKASSSGWVEKKLKKPVNQNYGWDWE